MFRTKETLVTAFALFSLFFGAGNLILPPQLGFKSGELWWLVSLGFALSAVLIPILGILGHAKLQGTMYDFASKISPTFSLVYCFTIYGVSISLPSPRTASVTHEMGIAPLLHNSSLSTSIVYFVLVFIFVMNRSKILDIIGKYLTPAIILILLLILGITLFSFPLEFGANTFEHPVTRGILEGYQTFDAIGAIVVGGVIITSINLFDSEATYESKKVLITRAGWLAGLGLIMIYAGLIFTGAVMQEQFDPSISRTSLITGISKITLGSNANILLGVLVSLACFTTAVGIVAGTADFVKSRLPNSNKAYLITALISSFMGVLMGQFNVDYIIAIALPVLMFIYPITIVLILLNVVPQKYSSPKIFRIVVFTTFLFSIPDFLGSVGLSNRIESITEYIPLSNLSMGWVLPALIVFIVANFEKNT
ncbi:branched-chain amino acid transport system II carrier protein [uncultured Eudoraea sp.]|uniref:branched-chain amino acid transport system II carrier protein n=1 Tax=uncultured Eudoraea sp. TaxID=1035614 RepID=UPI00260D14DE|nr:branched-chain amino acid transport system II carrier protein [uncultured Eudoraea sp.]